MTVLCRMRILSFLRSYLLAPVLALLAVASSPSLADENGISFLASWPLRKPRRSPAAAAWSLMVTNYYDLLPQVRTSPPHVK